MAQIPIGDSPTDFYTVETRLFAGYDDEIPDEAVVIHKVDTTLEDRLAQVVDVDNNGDPNDAGAMWTPGEIFTGYGKQPPGLDRGDLLKRLPRDHQHQPCHVQHL